MTSRRNTYLRWGLLALFLLPFALQAQQVPTASTATPPPPTSATSADEKTIVDYDGDLMTKRPGDTVLYLIDNVAFHHNGTFIQCDSAKRYDDYRMECFGNVIINKDSTYIYGDRADYDGHTNVAKVYSPLLKLVNGDATMWVYNYMEFNTKTNIGEYDDGGVITQRDNLMESDRGIFNGDSSTIVFFGHVAMRNDNYKMRTDSVIYNLNNEVVTFLTKTYIWDKDRDFLTADRGNYTRSTEIYHFTRNAYAMTVDQEFWADTMDYESLDRKVTMQHNIQILDTAQRAIGLGDFGYYSDSLKNGMLTDNPAVILYDSISSSPTGIDSAVVVPPVLRPLVDTADTAFVAPVDSTFVAPVAPSAARPLVAPVVPARPDSVFTRADTILFNSYPPGKSKPKPTPVAAATADSTRLISDTLAATDTISPINDSLPILPAIATDSTRLISTATDTLPPTDNANKITRQPIGVEEPPLPVAPDSTLLALDSIPRDSLPTESDTTLAAQDSLTIRLPLDSIAGQKRDTLERIIRAQHNVRLFRTDVQGICDSLTAYSVDSMASLFGRPLIWNGDNQLAADQIDIYSKNEALDYAEFIGDPFITQQVEYADTLFNQAQGRFMQAWFEENEISRAILTGNVLNYYYMGDDSLPPDKFAVISCATLTIDFEEREPIHMVWGGQGDWHIDPINKIPADQSQRLPNFSWKPELKPRSRYDITLRAVRPSERSTAESYARPVFTIEEQFNATKASLLKGGTWRDRNEPLRVTLDTFLNNNLLY